MYYVHVTGFVNTQELAILVNNSYYKSAKSTFSYLEINLMDFPEAQNQDSYCFTYVKMVRFQNLVT